MRKKKQLLRRGTIAFFALAFFCTLYEARADVSPSVSEVGYWQQSTVSGTVKDETGTPLPGASIVEKGTANGVQTDFDGNFSIRPTDSDAVLLVSYIGYKAQEITLKGKSHIDVVLQQDASELDEVVVIGYGSQKKSDLTGAVATVGSEKIQERISINALDNLQGKVAGLNVFNSSGRPGGGFQVTIRGKGSLNADNEPLYVVDGIIGVDIELINTNDIETITVLKDASATAIYGARGANGVILVTTKKGKSGRFTVDVLSNLQVGRPANQPEVLNSDEYWNDLKVRLDADQRALGAGDGSFVDNYPNEYPRLFTPDGTRAGNPIYDTDWFDETTRTTFSQQYFVNVRGGGEKSSFSFSAGTQDDEGILNSTFFKKNTMRFNGDFQVNDWLKIGGSLAYSDSETNIVDDYRIGADGLTYAMLFYLPIYPTEYPDGTPVNADDLKTANGGWDVWYGATPKDRLELLDRLTKNRQVVRNIFTEIDFLNNLTLRTSYSVQDNNIEGNVFTARRLDTFVNRNSASLSNSNSQQVIFENTLRYNTIFDEDHNLGVILGTTRQETEAFGFGLTVQDFDDFYSYYNVGQGTAEPTVNSEFGRYTIDSYFGRVDYGYKGKYLLTVTGRYDGSSRFGENNKYSFFPSAALGWRVSNEPFMENSSTFTNLKLRASYGETGNDAIGNYARIASPGAQTVIFNNERVTGSSQGTIGNNDLKWETTEEFNVGLDLGIANRVNITADYYQRTTKDLLFNVPMASFSGYSSILSNAGSIRNSGIELLVNTLNVQTNNFSWSTSINFTKNNNEILSLGNQDADIFTAPIWWNQQIFRVGEAAGSFWGYNRLGTWGTDEVDQAARYGRIPGDIKLEDKNDDGILNFEDQQIIGSGLPDYTMNIGNTFSYKNWDLSVDILINQGNDILDHSIILNVDRVGYGNTYKKFFDQMWTPENQNTMYPRVRKDLRKFDGADSGQVFDGSFIRGQNLSLAYNFDELVLDKIGLQSAKIYLNLQNFFLSTDYHGYDPEVSSFGGQFTEGIELNGYPRPTTMNLGFMLTL
ncbi:SusC/RagA family TonB-linked outer membrane protein [Pseudozobellia thermophila]|uniref:TonB-linked outer membrane protein, SusC/RagA family n=1 Tax=Pseudozobellia thermophila TaxID=192903 RepID=A0A1M6GF79_9FLAO|nr:TonB-dependent receptor [Pseudozobellia thermophila]SHJ08579.1 TonB-linked outer membrane protein, SusC/RagA family [Pseudozobellia thermophila]